MATNNNNQQQMNQGMNQNGLNNPKIQQLAAQTMQNMANKPALQEYANYQMQNPRNQHNQQQQRGGNDNNGGGGGGGNNQEPSDLDNTNLYIKGLWKDCTQVELDDLFKQFGVISQSRVYGDGVGFVRFEEGYQARDVKIYYILYMMLFCL